MNLEKKVSVQIITNENEFFSLKDQWNELLTNSSSNNIFLTWEWMFSWWQIFRKDKSLVIVVLKDQDGIIGIAPLYTERKCYFGIRPLIHLEFIGSFDASSEYLDFILKKDAEKELISILLKEIFSPSSISWSVFNLISMRDDSVNFTLLKEFVSKRKLSYWVYDQRECPFISLPANLEEYMASLSRKTRWKFKDYKKKLLSEFSVEHEIVKDMKGLNEKFLTFKNLHQMRWKQKNGQGSFSKSRSGYLAFHDNLLKPFYENKWLYLTFLKANGNVIAGQYNFIYNNKLFCYSVGFDPAWNKYNVATILQLMMVEFAIKMKLREFDFLRGTEEYKFYWTKKTHISYDIAVWRSTSNMSVVFIERWIKRIPKIFSLRAILRRIEALNKSGVNKK